MSTIGLEGGCATAATQSSAVIAPQKNHRRYKKTKPGCEYMNAAVTDSAGLQSL